MSPTATAPSSPIMYSPISNYGDLQNMSTMAQPQPGAATNSPNALERLLPTGASILGGILGSFVAPGAGSVAGAALGGALGKAGENALTGQKVLQGNDLTEGLESGVGQIVGLGAGKALGGILGAVGSKAGGVGDRLVQGQFAKGTGVTGDMAHSLLNDYGISDARQIPQIASHVTGSAQGGGAALNKGVEQALMESGAPVNVDGLVTSSTKAGMGTGLTGMVNDLVDNETSISPNAGNKIINTVKKSVQNMLGGPAGMVGKQAADPLDALKESRVFRTLANQAQQKAVAGAGNAEQAGVANVYNQLAEELESRTFSPGGQNIPLSDDIKGKIIDGLSGVKDVNPQAYATIVKQVGDAQTAQDLRPLQSLWVKAGQAFAKTANKADANAGLTTMGVAKGTLPIAGSMVGGPKGLLAGVLPAAASSPLVDRVGAKTAGRISDILTNPAMKKIVKLGATVPAQISANAGNDIAAPVGAAGLMTGANAMQPGNQIQGGNTYNELLNAMMAQAVLAPNMAGASGATSLVQSALPQLQQNQLLGSELNALPGAYANAGGAQGMGGILSRLTGLIPGTPANAFAGQSSALASQLAAQLGISPEAAAGLLPQLMQSQGTAQQRMGVLGGLQGALGGGL